MFLFVLSKQIFYSFLSNKKREQNYQRAYDNAKIATELGQLLEEREEHISRLQSKIDADTQKMRFVFCFFLLKFYFNVL